MNDVTTTTASIAQIVSAGGGVAFAWLVYRLLDRFLEAQAERDKAHAAERRELQEAASEERAAMLKFMGALEERTRDDRRERVRTSPFGVPTRRRTHSDTEAQEE